MIDPESVRRGHAFVLAGGRHRAAVHILRPASSTQTGHTRLEPMLLPADPMPPEVVIGRALACCVHPSAAWRRLRVPGRVLLVAAYVSASYVTVLILLFIV